MGKIAGFGNPDIFIGREGAMIDLETQKGRSFRSTTEIGQVNELWSHGLWVFHNPNAKLPLPLDFFPDALNVFLDAEGQRKYGSERRHHIIRSVTQIVGT